MKNSSYGYYGTTAAASAYDDVVREPYGSSRGGPVLLSRGMQLEAAVDKLPGWYFDVDDHGGYRDDDDDNNNSSSSMSRSGRGRQPQHFYLDDALDALGPVAESTPSRDGDDDDSDSDGDARRLASRSSRSIRSRYLCDSPDAAKRAEPMSNSTSTAPSSGGAEPLELRVVPPASTSTTNNNADASPQAKSRRGSGTSTPPTGRQHRLSSRRSTLSSSCACTDLVVTRYTMGGREKKVMYHIDVVNHESQLSTYTIRRSYTDFKALHSELSAVLEARKEYYASRASLRQAALEPGKDRRSLASGAGSFSARNGIVGTNGINGTSASPEDALEAAVLAFQLPTLPHAGLLSFWRRHDHSHLKHRCEAFQALLRAVLQMPFLRESFAMQRFLSTAPCAIRERGSSYVSLCEYSVPHIDLDEEHRERRRRAQEHRRNSSVTSVSMGMYEY